MKQFLLLLSFVLISFFTLAQVNQWTWVGGDGILDLPRVYGTKGIASPSNTPGGRGGVVKWTDAAGNLWLFGGFLSYSGINFNDLWKYTPSIGQWTWVSGDTLPSQFGIYGTKGVAAPGNKPTARGGAVSWMDAAGNLWLFGGYTYVASGSGYLNDLWKYTPSTDQWTWVSGDNTIGQPGVYGTKAIAAPVNKPGARSGCVSWTDKGGNLWLFGGYGYTQAAGVQGLLNDLWKFAPSSGQWSWVNGDSIKDQRGLYGRLAEAKPGSGSGGVGWTDPDGNFWLFGGYGYSTIFSGGLNDLWKFDVSTGYWAFVRGDTRESSNGNYSTKGVPSADVKPSSRSSATTWTDPSGNLWLFGGSGMANFYSGSLNDVWKFTPSTTYWTWIAGDNAVNQPGVYGTKGVAAAANKPPARSGAVGWTNQSGALWLYGGGVGQMGQSFYSDVWKFTITSNALSGLSAQPQQQTALLSWTTKEEQNVLYYSVERSSGGAYDSIGMVTAVGVSSSPTTYSFTDKAPLPGFNLYRLKQVNKGGEMLFSSVANVIMGKDDARFNVVQNPVQSTLQIRVQLPEAEKLSLEIRNQNGHLLISEMRINNPGNSVFAIPVDHLAKGTYLVTIHADDIRSTKLFIKQ